MTLTIKLNPDAVWDDGTPITSADFECTCKATLNTPGSLTTVGYDKITSVDAERSRDGRRQVLASRTRRTRTCSLVDRGIIKADAVANCDDISGRPAGHRSRSRAGRGSMESWSPDQVVLVPNDKYWVKDDIPKAAKVVMVPKADSDTEINSLKSGEVDFIFPQAFAGITDALNDPNIKYTPGYGTNYEGLYFQQSNGVRSRTRSSARRSPSRSTAT